MNPWEEYASPTQEAGPWAEYQAEGPWSEYKQEVKGQDPSVGGMLADLAKQPFYAMRGANVAVRQALGDVLGDKGMQERAQKEAQEIAYQRKAYSPQFESETAQGLYSGAQSLARQGPAIAVGIATGGAALPLAMLGADTGGEAYTKYRGRGAEPGMAALGAAGEAGVEVGTELFPMGFLVKKFGKIGAGQFLTGLLAREIPGEQAATLAQDAIDTAIANPNKTWEEYVAERPGAMYQTLLATISQAGLMAGGSKVYEKYRERKGIKPDDVQNVENNLDNIDLRNADQEEALKQEGQGTIFVDQAGTASDTLGTQITEDPAVTDYARAQVQDRLGEQPPQKFSYLNLPQQELFPPISGPHYPDATSAGQQSLDLKTPPDGLPPEPPGGGMSPSNAMRTEDDITLTREKNNFVQELERYFTETGQDPEDLLFLTRPYDNGLRNKIEAAIEAAISKVKADFYYEFTDRYGLRDQWGREDVGPDDTRMDRNYRLIEDAKKAMNNLDPAYLMRQAMANIRQALGMKVDPRNATVTSEKDIPPDGEKLTNYIEDWVKNWVRENRKTRGNKFATKEEADAIINDPWSWSDLWGWDFDQAHGFNPKELTWSRGKRAGEKVASLPKKLRKDAPTRVRLNSVPKTNEQIQRLGHHLTDQDYLAAAVKKIAGDTAGIYSPADKAAMMKDPRKYITPEEAQSLTRAVGPGSVKPYDPQTLKSYDKTTGEFSGQELLQEIIDDPKFRGYSLIAKYVIKWLNKFEKGGNKIRWALDLNPDGTPREYTTDRYADPNKDEHNYGSAHFDSALGIVWLGYKNGLSPRTILHEAIHAITVRIIDMDPKNPKVKAIKFIFDSVKRDPIFHQSEVPWEQEYGLLNLKEFLSEAFTNPRFQMKLMKHEVKGMASSGINAMRALAEQVRKLLGIQEKAATTTLEELMMRTDELVEENYNRRQEFENTAKTHYRGTRGIEVIEKYRNPDKWLETNREGVDQIIGVSKEGLNAIAGANPAPVDADDAKAAVLKDTIGVEWVAKDPEIDDALIDKMSKEEDGSDLWAATPGALARSYLANSTLVRTVYRLLDNASKRIALQIQQTISPVEKQVVKLMNGNGGRILHDIMMRELRNGRDYTTEELREAGVKEDVIMAHLEMRAMLDYVFNRMNLARADKNLPPVSRMEAYVSSRWSGPWRTVFRDEDGNVVWVVAEHSKKAAKQAVDYINNRFPGLKADPLKYKQGLEKGDNIEGSYLDMLELLDKNDPRIPVLKSIYEEHVLGTTENVANQEKHFIKKTGVRGFAGDRPWSDDDVKQMFIQQFEYAKNALRWAEYQKAVDKIKPLVNDPKLKDTQANNIAYSREYTKSHLGFGSSDLFNRLDNWVAEKFGTSPQTLQSAMGAAKTYFYLSRLGLSVPFTIAQFLQPMITTPAWHSDLSSKGFKHNPVVTALMGTMVGIEAATWHYMKARGADPAIVENLMDSVDRDAARWMEANGIIDINQLSDIKRDLRPEAIKKLAYPFEFSIRHSEVIARSMAFMSFVQHLKQSGKFDLDSPKGRAELFQLAEDMTKVSMTDYRSTERALMFERGGLTGDAAATLHSYQINNLFQLWHFTKEFKKGNKMPLLTMIFMQALVGGTVGLWFIDDLDDFWQNIIKLADQEDYEKLKKWSIRGFMLEHFHDLVSYGAVSTISGTNIHTRVSAADQVPFMPFEPMDLSTAKGTWKTVGETVGNTFPFAGTTGNLIGGAYKMATNRPDRQKWEALYAAAPAVAQGPMESLPAFNEVLPNGKVVSKKPSDLGRGFRVRTEEEKALRNWGFRSTAEQKHQDKDFMNSNIEKEIARRLQNAGERSRDYFLDGDIKQGVEELRKYTDLGGDPRSLIVALPKAKRDQATVEVQRRAISVAQGKSRASILKLQRYLENVNNEKATPVPAQ